MQRPLAAYPILFGIYPVLFLYAHNADMLSLHELWIPLLLVSAMLAACWALFGLAFRDWQRAAMITGLLAVWSAAYDLLASVLQGSLNLWCMAWYPAGWHDMTILVIWLLLLLIGIILLTRSRIDPRVVSILNTVSLLLVAFTLVTIIPHAMRQFTVARTLPAAPKVGAAPNATGGVDTRPNIYLIILDGYAREDILRTRYGFDNRPFLTHLRGQGFFVADQARSNYGQTLLSLSSMLNLGYLDGVARRVGLMSGDRKPLAQMICQSRVAAFLRARGYGVIAFASGFEGTEMRTADLYHHETPSLSLFQFALLDETPIPVVMHLINPRATDPYYAHRQRILSTFAHLADPLDRKRPMFVFAHIIIPHPPFVFDENGAQQPPDYRFNLADGNHYRKIGGTQDNYRTRYIQQLRFVNDKVERMIGEILRKATRRTIIIMQGDHGPGLGLLWEEPAHSDLDERFSIFQSYYLPRGDRALFPPDTTPVNNFRRIFTAYFGADFPPLPNRQYFATWLHPYAFIPLADVNGRLHIQR